MRQKSGTGKAPAEQVIKDIRRATRKQYSAEEKIRIVLDAPDGADATKALFVSSVDGPRRWIAGGNRLSHEPWPAQNPS